MAALRRLSGALALAGAISLAVRGVPLTWAVVGTVLFAVAWWILCAARPGPSCPAVRPAAVATVLLLLASLALALALLEAGARLFLPQAGNASAAFRSHPEYLFLLAPNGRGRVRVPLQGGGHKKVEMRVSSQGLRDDEVPPKVPGEFRIAMLGDSYTMGHATALEDTIPKQLERRLRDRRPDTAFRVLNGGIGGGGPLQELGMLREYVLPLGPDLVILQVCPQNDFGNALESVGGHLRAYDPGWLANLDTYRHWGLPQSRADAWAFRLLRAYQALCTLTGRRWIAALGNRCRFLPPADVVRPPAEDRAFWIEANLTRWYPELEEGYRLFCEQVLAIRRACDERGIAFAAYCIPDATDVSDDSWQYAVGRAHPPAEYERRKALRRVEEFLRDQGIPYTSVLEPLRAYGPVEETYYILDGHLNEVGHGIVADTLADFVLDAFPEP